MTQRIIGSPDELTALVGQEVAVTDSIHVSQDRIDAFAEATGDKQWIHLDRERSRKESPYGTTVAHGFLTLSLLTPLLHSAIRVNGVRMGINYGLDRVRFPAAVPSGSNIRARIKLLSVEDISGGIQAKWAVTVEREGAEKPVCAAEWLVRYLT